MKRPRPRVLVAATAVVALAAVLVVRLDLLTERADAGASIPGSADVRVAGFTHELVVPGARLRVTVSELLDELPAGCCGGDPGADLLPPRGGSFVGLEVQTEVDDVPALVVPPGAEPATPSLTLLVEQERDPDDPLAPAPPVDRVPVADLVAVGSGGAEPGTARTYVAVAGEPETADLELEVEYDGRVQTIDPSGSFVDGDEAARELARRADASPEIYTDTRPCGRVTFSRGFVIPRRDPTGCRAHLMTTPYVAGLGWAPAGRTWAVARARLDVAVSITRTTGRTEHGYDLGSGPRPRMTITVDGEPPEATYDRDGDGAYAQVAIAPTREDLAAAVGLDLTARWSAPGTADPNPVDTVTARWDSEGR